MDAWQRTPPRNRVKDVVLIGIALACVAVTVWYVVRDRGDEQANAPQSTPAFVYRTLGADLISAEGFTQATAQIPEEDLLSAMQAAADYLGNATQADGKFNYRLNLDPSVRVNDRYNILRHAGTVYAMASYQRKYPSPRLAECIAKATEFLKSQSSVVPELPQCRAVWSEPELNNSGAVRQSKLGGNGLALVALCAVEQVAPGTTAPAELQGLAEFILHLQKQDGSFHSKYIPAEGGMLDTWTSLYYPGEAALGLIVLYELDANPRWRDAGAAALLYLATSREDEDNVPPDHWAMIATARLLALPDDGLNAEQRQTLIAHARRVCGELANSSPPVINDALLVGSLTGDGRTTPTATRMEGLLAAVQADLLLGPAAELTKAQAGRSIAFLLHSQIPNGPYAGGIPRAIARLPENEPQDANEDFNRRASEIRIDYVQHALSAMLSYQELTFSPLTSVPANAAQ